MTSSSVLTCIMIPNIHKEHAYSTLAGEKGVKLRYDLASRVSPSISLSTLL